MALDRSACRLSSPHSVRHEGAQIHLDKKITEMMLGQPIIVSVMRNGANSQWHE